MGDISVDEMVYEPRLDCEFWAKCWSHHKGFDESCAADGRINYSRELGKLESILFKAIGCADVHDAAYMLDLQTLCQIVTGEINPRVA